MNHTALDRASRCDGATIKAFLTGISPGTVLRMVNPDGTVRPFSDHVVLRADGPEDAEVTLARPYAYGRKSPCTTALTGLEELRVPMSRITAEGSPWEVVLAAGGAPYKMEI